VEVEAEREQLEPKVLELADAEQELAAIRERFEAEWAEGVAAPSSDAAEARGELAALRSAWQRDDAERQRVRTRLGALTEQAGALATEAERLRGDLVAAEQSELPLVESLDGAEQWRRDAEQAVGHADDALRAAERDHHAWQARAEALALALDEARAAAGTERLASIDGVLGTLLDLVEIDDGWQPAFEAAAGDALAAVVVADVAAGRQALTALHDEQITGAVLALPDAPPAAVTPPVGEPVRRHVRATATHPEVDRVLDALLAAAVVVDGGWPHAVDAVLAHPSATVVTRDGDRFGVAGWRIGAGGSGATGAALDEARQRVADATAAVEVARRRRDEARSALDESAHAEGELARRLDENDGRLSAAGDGLQRVETDRRQAEVEAESLQAHVAELDERAERTRARIAEIEASLPALEADENETLARGRALGEARAHLEERATEVGAMRTDLEVQRSSATERAEFLGRRLAEIDERLSQHSQEREDAERRRLLLARTLVAVDRLAGFVAERQAEADEVLADLRETRRKQSEATRAVALKLDGYRKERVENEKQLTEVRERLQRVEIEDAEIKLRIESATEALRRDLDTEPAAAMAAECPELAEGVTASNRVHELERELRIMGPINPLALEEFEALQERHGFLQQQLDDVKESRRELHKIIKAIDEEIVNVFAAAFADVSQNFTALFETLFPGGSGRLRLTEPDDLLETGIEVEAKPSGKNVRKLSLLSGGERSLTALAYLFAVFRSRPSPFYVMDEVEAALDDVNLHRFLGLVNEFRDEAQLIIVSHQKRTMEAADVLYGVTMQPGGSSRVVSEKVDA
jgi:chromosome segregation protein